MSKKSKKHRAAEKARAAARAAAAHTAPSAAAPLAAAPPAQPQAKAAPVAGAPFAGEQRAGFAGNAGARQAHQAAPSATLEWARRRHPNWPLLALALLGMALAGYLSYTAWAGEKLAYCGPGSGCETVQSSRWATLFGVPVAFWGFLAYAALAWLSAAGVFPKGLRIKDAGLRWQAAWFVALPALGVSLYLTAVSLWVLQASCAYCLGSLGLIAVVVAVLAVQGRAVPGISWPAWLGVSGGLAAALVLLLHLHYSGVFSPAAGPEDPYLSGLAERLKASGAIMYGASWCPHCQDQKAMFGPAAQRLPYVECSPDGPNAPSAPACVVQGVDTYPTWIFSTERHVGELSIEDLARRAGYPARPKSP
ncbi:MAG: vitamin K epoxide reductase family protein [SAR324 cluster bacterium]